MMTPFTGLSRGCGNSSLVRSTERFGASPVCRLPVGLYGLSEHRISGDGSRWNGQHRLKERAGRDIGSGQLVHDSVAIGIGPDAKALRRLHAVVLVERFWECRVSSRNWPGVLFMRLRKSRIE